MAVLQRTNWVASERQAQLTERLEAEWGAPQSEEPIIIQESPRDAAPPNHLYVIWQEWSDLSPLARSRIVLTAYERHLGPDAALVADVTLAMGLTPDEARLMNIKF